MINQYKRLDVFTCNYESHSKFGNKVSVFHVLKERKCYPQGCVYFKWQCHLMQKGKRCTKGFNYTGKKCFGCGQYSDIKIHSQPSVKLSPEKYRQFTEELQLFEEWLFEIENQPLQFWGVIDVVKPHLQKTISANSQSLKLSGFTLIFREAYFDTTHYEDLCYWNISPDLQQKLRFAAGDEIELVASIQMDRGRILLRKARNIEINKRSGGKSWTLSDALVVKQTATFFSEQPAQCLSCAHGVLIDVQDESIMEKKRHRELCCLEGVQEIELCTIHLAIEELAGDAHCP